jgi:hypothetical protein
VAVHKYDVVHIKGECGVLRKSLEFRVGSGGTISIKACTKGE